MPKHDKSHVELLKTWMLPLTDIKQTFETNVFGVLRVAQAFLPLLRKSKAARIVMRGRGLAARSRSDDRWAGSRHVVSSVRRDRMMNECLSRPLPALR